MSGLKSSLGLIRAAQSLPTGSNTRACLPKASTSYRQSLQFVRFRYYATTPTDSPPPNPNGPQWQMPPLREAPPNSLGPSEPPQKGYRVKVAHVFFGLTGLGLFIAIYGILEFYFALPKWPETVRTPLRQALRARNMKEYDASERFFKEAIAAALALPPSEFDPDPLLKLSGIYITYATLLEEINKRAEAYTVLREGLSHFGPSPMSTDPAARISGQWYGPSQIRQEDHIRAIGLSQKLGQLALMIATGPKAYVYPIQEGGPTNYLDAAENHLSDALTAMLHLGLAPTPEGEKKGRVIAGRDVNLPSDQIVKERPDEEQLESLGGSVDRKGLGVTMEALAEIYARKGQYGIAGNLLIQSISTLLPASKEEKPPIPDQCQAAMLMTTVSSHALHPHTPKAIKAARSWSLRALQIADGAIQEAAQAGVSTGNTLTCRRALAVGSYNLGMLSELDGDLEASAGRFDTALKVSRDIGFHEGAKQASDGIRRVRSLLGTPSK